MAEFKDISLFATITPNLSTAQNYFVQVSATEKVSLAAIAGLVNVPGSKLGAWTPAAGTIAAKDTILQALQKLQGNFGQLALEPSSPSGNLSSIEGGKCYIASLNSSVSLDVSSFDSVKNSSIIISQGGQWSTKTFTGDSAEVLVQKDFNDIGSESESGNYVITVVQYLGNFSGTAYFAINASIYQ